MKMCCEYSLKAQVLIRSASCKSSTHNKRFYGETKNGEVLLMSTHNMLLWRNKKNNIYVAMPYIWSIAFFHTLISLNIVMTDVTICI